VTATIPAFRALPAEMQQAAGAAAGLGLTLFLPWYEKSFFDTSGAAPRSQSQSLSAFGVFSFVEAAILLVAAGVLYLIWARSQRKGFHLPGGDGTVIMAAGGWAFLLLVWRLFDKPDVDDPGATVGIGWGIFVALVAAGALTAAGARVRAAHRPEPPNPAADDAGWERPPRAERRRAARRPREVTAVTEAFSRPPGWEGDPPEAPGRAPRPGTATDEAPPEDDEGPPPDPDRLF
jgi:hypothetical protein